MPTTYALRLTAPNTFQIAKFSDDFMVEATYTLTRKGHGYSCDCPAGYKSKLKPCKHQRMMPYLMGAVNLPRFFDPETGNWHGLMALAPGMQMEHVDGEAAIGAVTGRVESHGEHIEEVPQVQKGVVVDEASKVTPEMVEATKELVLTPQQVAELNTERKLKGFDTDIFGRPFERVEPASGRLDAVDKSSDDAQPEEAQVNGEPATAPTPAVSGQVGVSPQTERPMAPAPSAPASQIVTRRI